MLALMLVLQRCIGHSYAVYPDQAGGAMSLRIASHSGVLYQGKIQLE